MNISSQSRGWDSSGKMIKSCDWYFCVCTTKSLLVLPAIVLFCLLNCWYLELWGSFSKRNGKLNGNLLTNLWKWKKKKKRGKCQKILFKKSLTAYMENSKLSRSSILWRHPLVNSKHWTNFLTLDQIFNCGREVQSGTIVL